MKNWKPVSALALALTILSGCAASPAPAQPAQSAAAETPVAASAPVEQGPSGSATATAQGLDETVTVTLTMENGKITDVQASTDKADSPIGGMAIEQLPAAMKEKNSVKVDAVTGATITSKAVISAATAAYFDVLGTEFDFDAWVSGQGYVNAASYDLVAGVDAVTSATVSGEGGINFGDVDLSDELKKELILEYLKGAENNYREMYQIATSYNNVPTIGSVEYVLDPSDMTLFGSSESNTAKLNNMERNPNVDLYWTRQIREGDVCSAAMPVLPTYFMSYGVEIAATYRAIHFAELSKDEIPVFVAKARTYFATLSSTAQLAAMDDDALYAYLCSSPMNFYQLVPSRFVITSPWFLNVYDSGYSRQFLSAELQAALLAAVQEKYPETTVLTSLDFATFTATGLKTQQLLNFDR
ncbi:MAG: FMN-binding protein [Ruminococcaceae bacterium]|nr:FMN-binding protein [Oscillospiraceae bacterium]